MKIYLFLLIFINIIFVYNKTVSSRKTNYTFEKMILECPYLPDTMEIRLYFTVYI